LAALSLIFGFIFLPTFSHLNALAFNFRSGQTLERSIAINRWMLEKSAGRPALLWFPYHPTYTRHCLDSSMPLHHFILQDTQPLLSTNFAGMRNIADRIIQCRPGLVDLNETIPRLLVLTQWKILSRQDLQRILIYFRTDYQEVRAFDRIYLLLNNAARRTSINSIATILRTPAE
jgi:hypothetical protein